jgi:hypothetical protein
VNNTTLQKTKWIWESRLEPFRGIWPTPEFTGRWEDNVLFQNLYFRTPAVASQGSSLREPNSEEMGFFILAIIS